MAYIGNSPGVASQRVTTTFTATAGQTTFTPVSGYTLGYCDVYQNGVKLISGDDYTAADGVSVVLGTGAAAGDAVEVVAMFPRGLSDGYTKAEADARYDATGAASTAQSAAQTYAAGLVDDLSGVTDAATARTNLGLGNVENKSSATIRSEITSTNVTDGLGYTPVNKAGDTMTGGLTLDTGLGQKQLTVKGIEADIWLESTGSNAKWRILGSTGTTTHRFRIYDETAAAERLGIDSGGRVTMPYQPMFLARVNTDGVLVNFPGTDTKVTFSQVQRNIGAHFSSANSRFTAPVAGTYSFTFAASAIFNAAHDYNAVYPYLNGASYSQMRIRCQPNAASGKYGGLYGEWKMYLQANEYVELFMYSYPANSIALSGTEATWSGILLG